MKPMIRAACLDLPSRDATVGVLSGGRSRERDRSLLSGQAATEALKRRGYERTRLIDTADTDLIDTLKGVDVAFLAIAGQWAEDGRLQSLLELMDIPYTGSGVLPSALGMHKVIAKTLVRMAGVPVLPDVSVARNAEPAEAAQEAAGQIDLPAVVKPVSEGGSIDVRIVRTESELETALHDLGESGQHLMIEMYSPGSFVTVGVLDIDGHPAALPPLKATPKGSEEFYSAAAKNDDTLHAYQCPAELPTEVRSLLEEYAVAAHAELGCTGYSRSDFIVNGRHVWWLEINTLPGLSRTGNLATMAQAADIRYDALILHILATAVGRNGCEA